LRACSLKADEIESMFGVTRGRGEGIDILVNNAGIQHVAPLETFTAERWD
jgi:3-hydroxybutyrate dehydrogenase